MYKPSTYLVVTLFSYLSSYLPIYIWDLFPTETITKVKRNINSVEVHPQLSNNGHPVDGWCAGWCVLVHCGQEKRTLFWVSSSFARQVFPSVVVSHKLCQRAVWDGLRQLVTVMAFDMSKHKNLPAVAFLPASCMWLLSLQPHLQHLVLIIVVVASLRCVCRVEFVY